MIFGFYVEWMVFIWRIVIFHSLRLSINLSLSSKVRNGDRKLFFFRRTGRLPGWIRLLLVSVTTVKSINTSGAPCGTRRSNIYFVFCTYPKIISLSHNVIAVTIKWLISVKIYANNPRKLLRWILRNNEIKIKEFPLFQLPPPWMVFISSCSFITNRFHINGVSCWA